MPTISDIFDYVISLRQQLAQKDQIINSIQTQLKELQEEKKTHEKFEITRMQELEKLKSKEGKKWLSFINAILFNKIVSGASTLSDIMFLAKKEFDNKLFTETSSEFTTTGVKITRTPASGKTYYLAKAKVVLVGGGDTTYSGEILVHCQVKFDGTVIDNFSIAGFMEEGAGEGPGWGMSGVMPETTVIGKSFDGDAAKKVEVECIAITGTNVSAHVTLVGWEENTGTSPLDDF